MCAPVAQWIEHRFPKPLVGCSSHLWGAKSFSGDKYIMKPEIATIVAFYNAGKLCLGKVLAEEGGRYTVHTETGECVPYTAARFVVTGTSKYPDADHISSITSFRTAMETALAEVARQDYSFLMESPQSLAAIAEKLGVKTDPELFALYVYLKGHPEFFAHKKDMFRLKIASEIDEYNANSLAEEHRREYLTHIAEIAQGIMPEAVVLDMLYNELPEVLSDKKHKDIQKLLRSIYPDLGSEEAITKLRIASGELRSCLDPIIAGSGLPDAFSPLLLDESLCSAFFPVTSVTAFSIDDEDTRDYDDAISLVATGDSWQLGIHVSCVAARVKCDGKLFEQAYKRVSSLYAPNAVIPLFPLELSENELSLVNGSPKPVLSLYLCLDAGLNIVGSRFVAETIVIERNLSYREVDKAIDTPVFKVLWKFCQQYKEQRHSTHNGEKQRYYYYFKEVQGKLRLKCVDNYSPARQMVEELMIAYNNHYAAFAVRKNCPMLFRNISQFASPGEENPASQAYLATSAGFHPGIGTAAYLHATSPIRRIADLINQYQMMALLGGVQPPFSRENLVQHIEQIERKLIQIRDVSQRSQRYWFLKFLQQDWLNEPLDACVVAENHGKLRLEIMPWNLQVMAECDSYPQADCFKVVIYDIDLQELGVKAYIL